MRAKHLSKPAIALLMLLSAAAPRAAETASAGPIVTVYLSPT